MTKQKTPVKSPVKMAAPIKVRAVVPTPPPSEWHDDIKSIPVALVVFVKPQDGRGLSVRSSLTSRLAKGVGSHKLSKHEIEYIPALQLFKVKFFGTGYGVTDESVGQVFFLGAHRVSHWESL